MVIFGLSRTNELYKDIIETVGKIKLDPGIRLY